MIDLSNGRWRAQIPEPSSAMLAALALAGLLLRRKR